MDPNATLAALRDLAAWDSDTEDGSVVDTLTEIQERIQALDEWLTRGGFLPVAWQPALTQGRRKR